MDYQKLHILSTHHRAAILAATHLSCFYCCEIMTNTVTLEWIDEGQTALCPLCHIDSVLPGRYTPELLQAMHDYWFSPIEKVTYFGHNPKKKEA